MRSWHQRRSACLQGLRSCEGSCKPDTNVMTSLALLIATIAGLLVLGVVGAAQIYLELVLGASAIEDGGAPHHPESRVARDFPNSSAQNSRPA